MIKLGDVAFIRTTADKLGCLAIIYGLQLEFSPQLGRLESTSQ